MSPSTVTTPQLTRPRIVAACYAAAVAVNLISVGTDNRPLEWLSKPLLMPILIVLVIFGTSTHVTKPTVIAALGFATIADIALLVPGAPAFLIGMGCFAVMQATWIISFARLAAPRRLIRRWWLPSCYLLFCIGANTALWPLLGDLAVPMAAYSLLLVSMAAMAANVNAVAGIGGALFVVSDFMIGIDTSGIAIAGHDMAIMTTYALAQFLIVAGWKQATMTPISSVD